MVEVNWQRWLNVQDRGLYLSCTRRPAHLIAAVVVRLRCSVTIFARDDIARGTTRSSAFTARESRKPDGDEVIRICPWTCEDSQTKVRSS